MKKWLVRIGVLLVVVLVGIVLGSTVLLGAMLKRGIETQVPRITQTEVKLADLNLSLLSGRGEITGFSVGNPPGYKAASAIRVGRISLQVKPGSILSEKLVVRSIQVEGPEITWEGGFKDNNLAALLKNVRARAEVEDKPSRPPGEGKSAPPREAKPTRLQVDEFILSKAKVHYVLPEISWLKMSAQLPPIELPDVELRNLGQGEEGITEAELMQLVLTDLLQKAGVALTEKAVGLLK